MLATARLYLSEGGFPYGAFAGVMATGIVSIALSLEGWGRVSSALFYLNGAGFLLLLLALAMRFCAAPWAAASELFGGAGPISLTLVAALCVFGSEAALAAAPDRLIDAFCIAAVVL